MNFDPKSPSSKRIAVIIPHAGGIDILRDCLRSLQMGDTAFRLLLVDNASPDASVEMVMQEFPWVEILRQDTNLGFAGGCNAGLTKALQDPDCEYLVLLNNDTTQDNNWLTELVEMMDQCQDLGAAQPRLLSIPNPGKLDYSGAAGGLLDVYAYPFALGRMMQHIEEDADNWLEARELCWTSGTASIYRAKALRAVGLLDESFFMHMEEIDLNWRMRLNGWKLSSVPQSRVYHYSGFSLDAQSPLKIFLNHRNSLRMLLKNAGKSTLYKVLLPRLWMDKVAVLKYAMDGNFSHAFAAIRALLAFVFGIPEILEQRKIVQALRKVDEADILKAHYPGCLPYQVLIKGVQTVDELGWEPELLRIDLEETCRKSGRKSA
jgi:GT2 family glycosyltransferase